MTAWAGAITQTTKKMEVIFREIADLDIDLHCCKMRCIPNQYDYVRVGGVDYEVKRVIHVLDEPQLTIVEVEELEPLNHMT